ncbi:MAG: hypothetical protein Q8K36_05330 [Alphaproteobacteria bacterium]|nr:hypothetical protein [Alphaproteobacteria bacterium]
MRKSTIFPMAEVLGSVLIFGSEFLYVWNLLECTTSAVSEATDVLPEALSAALMDVTEHDASNNTSFLNFIFIIFIPLFIYV